MVRKILFAHGDSCRMLAPKFVHIWGGRAGSHKADWLGSMQPEPGPTIGKQRAIYLDPKNEAILRRTLRSPAQVAAPQSSLSLASFTSSAAVARADLTISQSSSGVPPLALSAIGAK